MNLQELIDTNQEVAQKIQESAPSFVSEFQKEAFHQLEGKDFPSSREEKFKYLNLKKGLNSSYSFDLPKLLDKDKTLPVGCGENESLICFINGHFSERHSSLDKLPNGVSLKKFDELDEATFETYKESIQQKSQSESERTFEEINMAFFKEAYLLHVEKGTQVPGAIQLLYLFDEEAHEFFFNPRHYMLLEEGSSATIVETYYASSILKSQYVNNVVLDYVLQPQSQLDHYFIQLEGRESIHYNEQRFYLGQKSELNSYHISLGGKLSRHNIRVNFNGEESQARLKGLYAARKKQIIDHHTELNHWVGSCTSRELFKGVMTESGRAVFDGQINVVPKAQLSDSKLMNNNLLLSKEARVDSKPELKIDADDVKCFHGATVGQLDKEQLFYLQSRGISKKEAINRLIYAFADDVLGDIKFPDHERLVRECLCAFYLGSEEEEV